MSYFSDALSTALESSDLQANKLAKACGVTHPTVSRWRSGQHPCNADQLARIAAVFGQPWAQRLVIAHLRDHCPDTYQHILTNISKHISVPYKTGTERNIENLYAVARRNSDFRQLLDYLTKIAADLPLEPNKGSHGPASDQFHSMLVQSV